MLVKAFGSESLNYVIFSKKKKKEIKKRKKR